MERKKNVEQKYTLTCTHSIVESICLARKTHSLFNSLLILSQKKYIMNALPSEILQHILQNLDLLKLWKLRRVSRRWFVSFTDLLSHPSKRKI
jgi:hypothetical protein